MFDLFWKIEARMKGNIIDTYFFCRNPIYPRPQSHRPEARDSPILVEPKGLSIYHNLPSYFGGVEGVVCPLLGVLLNRENRD